MEIRQGLGVSPGKAYGKILVYKKYGACAAREKVEDRSAELLRYESAKKEASGQIDALIERFSEDPSGQESELFKAHKLILSDSAFSGAIEELIKNDGLSAPDAVRLTGEKLKAMFEGLDDAYMRQRAADIEDVSGRLLGILSDKASVPGDIKEPVIVFAEDLLPGEMAGIGQDKLLALVLKKGSALSHTVILSGIRGIPCIVGADIAIDSTLDGKYCIADGDSGRVYIEPDEKERELILRPQTDAEGAEFSNAGTAPDEKAALKGNVLQKGSASAEDKAVSEGFFAAGNAHGQNKPKGKDGSGIRVLANITGPGDIDAVLSSGAEGIGLFRTEFIYLGREDFPSQEEQYGIYKGVLERMGERPVIFRTIDVGADKTAGYLRIPVSLNPVMGMRGIRYCLEHTDIFKAQLRAIYRAAAFGNAGILLPMIVSVSEVKRAKEIAGEVKKELSDEGISFGNAPVGVMIETPAAAATADLLAKEADFFSIDTNDLTQYMLASDREHQTDYPYFDPYPEAVLRMSEYACACASKQGIGCCMCGEMAADISLTERFIDMGIDTFSVSPVCISRVREATGNII